MRVTVDKLKESTPVAVGDLFTVFTPIEILATGEDLPYDIRLITAFEDGHVVVTSLEASRREGGPPVNGTGLRQVAIDRLVQDAFFRTALGGHHKGAGSITWDEIPNPLDTPGSASSVFLWESTAPSGDDEEVSVVASIYRVAVALGYPPVKAVAERIGVSPSTARGRIVKARKAGLLPPTVKGKAKG